MAENKDRQTLRFQSRDERNKNRAVTEYVKCMYVGTKVIEPNSQSAQCSAQMPDKQLNHQLVNERTESDSQHKLGSILGGGEEVYIHP